MTKMVSLTIDDVKVEVPEGTLVVDAAKQVGIDIPVFCYHPKMEPVGMCRMCLVEIGRPMFDRATGKPVLDEDGSQQIRFGQRLETACTTPVLEGMVVKGFTEKVREARKDVLEFLLTSHPLDCPVCDKGGECSLQNQTIEYGASESRFLYEEKHHAEKHVPLGDLIFLDRERCIQCKRCVRFQEEIADDPVIAFYHRGRNTDIVTYSDPGFASYFSGNTTDICPVGALTTADFRFKARPWEMKSAPSICTHCAVGCNLTLNVRREAVTNGEWVVKRVLPRQNEYVNEIWICDKGRFAHHFGDRHIESSDSYQRIEQPLVRAAYLDENGKPDQSGELVPTTWETALKIVAERFKKADGGLFTLVGGRLANEDLFNLQQFTNLLNGQITLYSNMSGGELTTKVGFAPGTNFKEMGEETAILVVASDLEEEAPLWWMRVKEASKRGAKVIAINPRKTKLDRAASIVVRYPYGMETAILLALLGNISSENLDLPEAVKELSRNPEIAAAAKFFQEAENGIILYGSEGIGLAESQYLAQTCASLLYKTGHYGKPNNGLLGVWQHANDQGAWEMGIHPSSDLNTALETAKALYIIAADPAGDDPALLGQSGFGGEAFVVVQDLFLTQTGRVADVVLPAQTWIEREGSFTSGERRVQRFYQAVPPYEALPKKVVSLSASKADVMSLEGEKLEGPLADYDIPVLIAEHLGLEEKLVSGNPSRIFMQLAQTHISYNNLSYQDLAKVEQQLPIIRKGDLDYMGTSYENTQGLGVQLPLGEIESFSPPNAADVLTDYSSMTKLGQIAFPVTRLYDHGQAIMATGLLHNRIGEPFIVVNAHDAERLRIDDGSQVQITLFKKEAVGTKSNESKQTVIVQAKLDAELPQRVVLVPRSFGIAIDEPTFIEIRQSDRVLS